MIIIILTTFIIRFRDQCKTHEYVYDSPMQVAELMTDFADKAQVNTQRYGSRPYGVGLLVIGYDVCVLLLSWNVLEAWPTSI